jgi:hypothetical protein
MRSARLALLLVLLLAATSVFAQHAAKGKPKTDDAPAASSQPAAADTNLRQPTKEEVQELTAGLERSLSQPTEGLRQFELDNGMVGVDLDGTHENVALAKRNPDGTISVGCVDNLKDAAEFLTADAPAKPAAAGQTTAKPAAAPKPAAPLEEK